MSEQASTAPGADIVFDNVSKFYGEVLGVNRVHLSVPRGITSLVGPNGSGKTTVMNLMTGLLLPSQGSVRVLGIATDDPERLFQHVGYCTQYDSFPRGATGREFVYSYLRVHGYSDQVTKQMTEEALERVGMTADAGRRVAAYSKGSPSHRPRLAGDACVPSSVEISCWLLFGRSKVHCKGPLRLLLGVLSQWALLLSFIYLELLFQRLMFADKLRYGADTHNHT